MLLGSPSTPYHSTPRRIAYGIVGLLVCLTGALGNAMVSANLQNLQGTFAAWSTEIAWRQFEGDDTAQRNKRQPQFKQVKTAPLIQLQYFGREKTGDGDGQR
jgi:hypothetical protein